MAPDLHNGLRMSSIDCEALEHVIGAAGAAPAGNWTTKLDGAVSKVYPGWNNMSCTSRGMWVGTGVGSATTGLGWASTPLTGGAGPAIGGTLAPIAGTLASTSYIEGCQHGPNAK
jgi:hypothetical protein